MGTTAEENTKTPSRTARQYSLNGDYVSPYYGPLLELPSLNYNTETRANNYFKRPFFTSASGMISNDKIFIKSFICQIHFAHSFFRRKDVPDTGQSSLWEASAVSSMSYLPNMSHVPSCPGDSSPSNYCYPGRWR
jgi:hypothetical protein